MGSYALVGSIVVRGHMIQVLGFTWSRRKGAVFMVRRVLGNRAASCCT